MTRRTSQKCGVATIHFVSVAEGRAYVTAAVNEAAPVETAAADAYAGIGAVLRGEGMAIVHERVFGSLAAEAAVMGIRRAGLAAHGIHPVGPVTYLQGHPVYGPGLAGVQIQAVRPAGDDSVRALMYDGACCGYAWEQGGASFLTLQAVDGLSAGTDDHTSQAAAMFDRTGDILAANGASYSDVVRTWIYVSEILDWYDDLNDVRNAKYGELGLMHDESADELRLPASTGIQSDNSAGAHCVMDVAAVRRADGAGPRVLQLSNTRQRDAFRYGSAFSRGACVVEPGGCQIHISGTAAIDEQGRSMAPGDVRLQVKHTFEIVGSLIGQCGAGLGDICQATAFLKRPEDRGVLQEVMAETGLAQMPVVQVWADVCRDDLLFEMDGIAASDPGACCT